MSLASNQLRRYIDQNERLWQLKRAVWMRLAKRKVRGGYSVESARRSFAPVVNTGAQDYVRERMLEESWSKAFPAGDRTEVAKCFEREFRARWKTGELDYLLPRPLRPRRKRPANGIRRGYSSETVAANISGFLGEGQSIDEATRRAVALAKECHRAEEQAPPLPDFLAAAKKRATKKRATKKRATKKRATKKRATKRTTKKRGR